MLEITQTQQQQTTRLLLLLLKVIQAILRILLRRFISL